MHARVLRLTGSAEKIDDGVEGYKSRVVPALREQDGYGGARLMIDRDTGAGMSVTFWRDDDAARASFDALASIREETTSRFGSAPPESQLYEAAVQHRPQPTEPGNWVRISTLSGDPAKVEDGILHFESRVIPDMSQLSGFRGAVLLVDRATGDALAATIWDSKRDLDASASQASSTRATAAEVMGAGSPQVENYEVAFAELLAPVAR